MKNIRNKKAVIERLKEIIYKLLYLTVTDEDVNLFIVGTHVSPIMMAYLLLELEKEFSITINDQFIDRLPIISINHLANAICFGSE